MQIDNVLSAPAPCCGRGPRFPFAYVRPGSGGLSGLSDGSAIIPILASMAGGPAAGAAAGAAMGPDASGGGMLPGMQPTSTTVSPAIQTQISPQISPVFQQSYMPQNSGMTAGTTQTAPGQFSAPQGMPGGMGAPGMPDTSGFGPGGFPGMSTPSPTFPPGGVFSSGQQAGSMVKYLPWALGGVAVIVILLALTGKKKPSAEPAYTVKEAF